MDMIMYIIIIYIVLLFNLYVQGSSIGWGSETFSIKEREVHIQALRGKSVYPVFALKGGEVNSRLNTPQTPMRGNNKDDNDDNNSKKNRYGNPEFITEVRYYFYVF